MWMKSENMRSQRTLWMKRVKSSRKLNLIKSKEADPKHIFNCGKTYQFIRGIEASSNWILWQASENGSQASVVAGHLYWWLCFWLSSVVVGWHKAGHNPVFGKSVPHIGANPQRKLSDRAFEAKGFALPVKHCQKPTAKSFASAQTAQRNATYLKIK